MTFSTKLTRIAAMVALLPGVSFAAPVSLIANRVIVDMDPFYVVDMEDRADGRDNFALNHPYFIDIPYAIFDFGSTKSVSNATLSWNFDRLYKVTRPAKITLYVGNDADGHITVDDRFMGTAVDTFTYTGGEVRNFDLTAYVNASLASGQYFAARLEATVAPTSLKNYYGGNFFTPSLNATATAVPEPATLTIVGLGLAALAFTRRCVKA